MSARRAVWEVARRELTERSRSRALRVTLVLLLILSVGGAVAAARLSGHTPTDDIGLVGSRSVALEPAMKLQAKAAGRRVHLHLLTNATAASSALRDGAIDIALLDANQIVVKTSRSQPAVRVVQNAVAAQGVFDRLRSSGLSQAQALGVLAPRALPVQALEPRPRNYDRNQALISISLMMLFLALLFFGQAVAQGVTEEKSSRVVELLLTTVSTRRLLTGKILGIGLLGLALLFIPGAAALAAGSLAGGAACPRRLPRRSRSSCCGSSSATSSTASRSRRWARSLPPRGPQHRDPAGHRRSDWSFLSRVHRSQHQPQRDAGADCSVPAAPLPDGRPRAHGARRHDRGRARDLGHARGFCHRRDSPACGAHLRASDPPDRGARQAAPPVRSSLAAAAPRKRHRQGNAWHQNRGRQAGRPQQRPT